MSGGTGRDTDWNLWQPKKWKVSPGTFPVVCPVDMLASYAEDTVFWKVSSSCLGSYDEIRISVEASVADTDYSPKRYRFHFWVARG